MKKGLVFIALLLILPIKVYAFTGTIDISCDKTNVSPGATIACTITGTSDEIVTSASIPFTISGGISVVGFTPDSSWTMNDLNNNQIDTITQTDITGSFTIGTLNLKVNDDATSGESNLSLNNPIFYDGNDEAHDINDKNVSITITGIKGLKSLTLTHATLGGSGFSTSTTQYYVGLENSTTTSFGISATPMKDDDTIIYKANDTTNIENPSNITFVTPTGQSIMKVSIIVGTGSDQVTYELLVSKPSSSETGNPTLSSLTIAGKTVDVSNENITVNLNNAGSYQLVATLSDSNNYQFDTTFLPNNSCSVSNGTLTCNLSGNNSIILSINAKASGGGGKVYQVSIVDVTSTTTGETDGGGNTANNPQTGNTIQTIVAIILVISFITTYYFFKQNIKNYNN